MWIWENDFITLHSFYLKVYDAFLFNNSFDFFSGSLHEEMPPASWSYLPYVVHLQYLSSSFMWGSGTLLIVKVYCDQTDKP